MLKGLVSIFQVLNWFWVGEAVLYRFL